MIINVCGFYATGASAVTDFLQEFDEVSIFDDFEFVMVQMPDGLEDLDFQLNTHCVKYASSVVAMERFRRQFFNSTVFMCKDKKKRPQLVKACDAFLNSITQSEWMGSGAVDKQLFSGRYYEYKYINMFLHKAALKIKRYYTHMSNKDISGYPLYNMKFSMNPNNFDASAKKFVNDILNILGVDFAKKVVLDQSINGNNPYLGLKFFDDPKVIIVDRDPRDLYLATKHIYRTKGDGHQLPIEINDFISYYRQLRTTRKYDVNDSQICTIQFEDMIYQYEKTCDKIIKFCELDNSKRGQMVFNPNISISGTQLINRYPEDKSEIEVIEKELKEYLYDYSKYTNADFSQAKIIRINAKIG